MKKHYISDIVTDYEIHDALPDKVEITVDLSTAREIVRVAAWIQESTPGVFSQFITLAKCLRYDPCLSQEQAAADPDSNIMQSSGQRLHVSANSFMVSVVVDECSFEVQTLWFPITDLATHFDLGQVSTMSSIEDDQ